MKKLYAICRKLFVMSFSLIVISCSSQKVVVKNSPVVIAPKEEPKFDLSFLEQSNKSYIDSSGNIIINDSILEMKVKVALNIQADGNIPVSIADTLTSLDISSTFKSPDNQKIQNIDALAFFKNLKSLNLNFNLIKNINSLKNLKNLTVLNAQNNRIQNISALKELKNLQKLNLYSNGISDISCLAYLKELTDLNLWSNSITNIKSLEGSEKLTTLNLGRNYITDISPLKNCKMLKVLWLYGNPLVNPEIISELGGNLETLSISNCNISDIKFLEDCTKLETLLIFDNTIKDISALRNMLHLYVFLASNNQIENIDVIAFLVDKGAFQKDSRFRKASNEIGTNIDITSNKIDYQLEKNQKIKVYLAENVAGIKF